MLLQADTDGNGFIDPEEMLVAVNNLSKRLGEQPESFNAEDLTTRAFVLFDIDHDGLIDAVEWKQMLSYEPWCELLPAAARESAAAKRHGMYMKSMSPEGGSRIQQRMRVRAELGAVQRSLGLDAVQPEEVCTRILLSGCFTVSDCSHILSEPVSIW